MKLEQPDNLALIAALPEKPDATVVNSCQLERDQDLYCAEFHFSPPLTRAIALLAFECASFNDVQSKGFPQQLNTPLE